MPEDRVLVSDPVAEVQGVGARAVDQAAAPRHARSSRIRIDLSNVNDAGPAHRRGRMIKLPAGVRVASIVAVGGARRVRAARAARRAGAADPRGAAGRGLPRRQGHRRARAGTRRRRQERRRGIERVPTRPLRITDARGPVKGEVALEAPPAHTRFLDGDDRLGARRRAGGDGRAHVRGPADQGRRPDAPRGHARAARRRVW